VVVEQMLFAFLGQKVPEPFLFLDKVFPLIDCLKHTRLAHPHFIAHAVDSFVIMRMSLKPTEIAFNRLHAGGLLIKVGDDKYLSFEQVKVVLFVLKTGRRLNNGPLELCEWGWVSERAFFSDSDNVIVEGQKVLVGFDHILAIVFERVVEEGYVLDSGVADRKREDVIIVEIQDFELDKMRECHRNVRQHVGREIELDQVGALGHSR
jgi:hypothetical protein